MSYELPPELQRLRQKALTRRAHAHDFIVAATNEVPLLKSKWYDVPLLAARLGIHRAVLYGCLPKLTHRKKPTEIKADQRLVDWAGAKLLFIRLVDPHDALE